MAGCEGCDPPPNSGLQPPPIVVQRKQELKPEAHKLGPLVDLFNAINAVRFDLGALQLALFKRGLLTEKELLEARAEFSAITSKLFNEQAGQLGRDFVQRPTTRPANPNNPRRSPT